MLKEVVVCSDKRILGAGHGQDPQMTMARQRIGNEVQRPLFVTGLSLGKYGPVPHQMPALLAPQTQSGFPIQPMHAFVIGRSPPRRTSTHKRR